MTISAKRLAVTFTVVGMLLLIPFIAMQFSPEVNWSLSDFVVMGALLSITGMGINLVLSKVSNFNKRVLLIAAVLLGFLLIWAELAVGIFGTPFAGS